VPTLDHSRSAELYRIDRQEPLPLYAQIERNLRDLIQSGRLQPGQHVPSEWELAAFYGVSRLTVRRAMDDLVRQDWLNRRHGVGTFVSRPAVAAIAPSRLSFTQEMLAIGRRPSSRLLSCGVVPAQQSGNTRRAATLLYLDDQDALVEIVRLRLADNLPLLLETAYLSSLRFPGLESDSELAGGSLYERMSARYGVLVARVDQTLKPVLLTAVQARHLAVAPGTPSILSEGISYTAEGEPVECSWSYANGEYSEFYFSFRRSEG
jgi:GntR family transcriptional regulator